MQRTPIVIARTVHDASMCVAPGAHGIVVLPSSLAADDHLGSDVARVLARRPGTSATALLPEGWSGRLRGFLGERSRSWRTIDLHAIDASCSLARLALPASLVEAGAVVVACDLDRVASRGPLVLDVAASYLAPQTRIRLHAQRGRLAAAAEVNLAIPLAGAVLGVSFGGERWYLGSPDPIASELAALALAEQSLDAERAVVGPWEDPIVQRSTELHLGALLPTALDISVSSSCVDEAGAQAIVGLLRRRLGVQ